MGSVWVIKRNGEEVEFDAEKISNAIQKANNEVTDDKKLTLLQIADVTRKVVERIEKASHAVNVERIQDLVEIAIMEEGGYEIAQKYVRYRYQREIARKANTTDAEILSLIECSNEEVNQENSNKDASINSTQRDYMAGQVSEFTQNEKWSVKGKLMGECWYKDCCVSEHPNNLRCGKPETVGGNEKMRMLIQSKKVQEVMVTLLNYPQKIKCITVDEMEW